MEELRSCYREVLDSVLSKLETRDLLRMKCVSKAWREIISDRSFALHHSRQRGQPPLTGFLSLQGGRRTAYLSASSISAGREEVPKLVEKRRDLLPRGFLLSSSCSGLVCCERFSHGNNTLTIRVGNPLTSEWVEIVWNHGSNKRPPIRVVLSFDPCRDITDDSTDFKVFLAFHGEEDDDGIEFRIYSSRTRSWKALDSDETRIMEWHDVWFYKCVSVKGMMYWLRDGNGMLVFDVENELAYRSSVPVPASESNRRGRLRPEARIGESNGELQYVMMSSDGFRMWVRDEDPHRKGNWLLLRYVKPDSLPGLLNVHGEITLKVQGMKLLAFKDGILLLIMSSNLFLYDTAMNSVARVNGAGSMLSFVPYSMSLVPLTRP